ncbi:MAG: sulfurtransferase-like selenium metabolism protein YedF [Spirochaetaceae bacterium]|nr:sulfurtransferase-like selenium metabolism protein YedF [Spirochaetaceae bacterium]
MKKLDMRGNPCPVPVVKAKEALAVEPDGVEVLVDDVTSVQNLEKMAKGTACTFSYTQEGEIYRVVIVKSADSGRFFTRGGEPASNQSGGAANGPPEGASSRGPVVLITADSMGRGSEELGRLLVKGFIFSLTQLNPPPEAVIFLNSGAHLTAEGSASIADLKTLEEKGSLVHTCGTCANYYKLSGSIAAGSIVDMMNIVNRLSKASSVITI